MSYQFTMTLAGDAAGSDKNAVVASSTPAEVLAGEISIFFIDPIDAFRKVEIQNGWEWLWHGIVERNILDPEGGGFLRVYSSAPLDSLRSVDRSTQDAIANVAAGEIAIGIGTNAALLGGGVILNSAFTQLREFAGENGPWV